MKRLSSIVLVLISFSSLAGGFSFPNVPYDHAKIYLFNVDEDIFEKRHEFSIYKNDVYALSKIGDGWEFTEQMNAQLNSVFKLGVDAMISGLSGCFIPRHGIIYFDKSGKPVASISLCLECKRIDFWSTENSPEFSSNISEKTMIKAEKQFDDLADILVKNNIPVFEEQKKYATYITQQDDLYSNNGEMIFDFATTRVFETREFSPNSVKGWIIKPEFKLEETNEATLSQRESDTLSRQHLTMSSKNGTKISFTSTGADATMTEAIITDPEIRIPSGISVGMSLEQVQNTFPIWDGIAWPTSIVVNYSDGAIRYFFKNRTLSKIKVVLFQA